MVRLSVISRQLPVISKQLPVSSKQLPVSSKQFLVTSKQLSVNSKLLAGVVLVCVFCLCGCESFRFAATEVQKENAWRHRQVCEAASEHAVDEDASEVLCGLTAMAADQSAAFVVDYGVPRELPEFEDVDTMLENGSVVAAAAKEDAARRPDVWTVADNALELGVALAGLVGGVYGVRAAGYLKTAREKSRALQEIVEGNELFKQLWPEQAERFKEAQAKQSATTKRLVTDAKAG